MALAFFSLGEKNDFEMPLIRLPDFPSRTVLGAHSHAFIDSPISLPTSLLVLPLGISTFSQVCCELLIYSGDQDAQSPGCELSLMVFYSSASVLVDKCWYRKQMLQSPT